MEGFLHGLAHVGMAVRDLAVTERFYSERRGFCPAGRRAIDTPKGDVKVLFLKNGNLTLECIQYPVYNQAYGPGNFVHAAIAVTDIEAIGQRLDDYGVKWVEGLRINADVGNKSMLFEGPDGEIVELNEELEGVRS